MPTQKILKDFKKAIYKVARQKAISVDKAFIHWYCRVAFGKEDPIITDGPRDGGIDAIVRIQKTGGKTAIYILQFKYTDSFFQNVVLECSP